MGGLTHVDLFSGIGGFALAAGWAGFTTVAFCECDPYCQAVLKKWWPEVPIVGDIRSFNWPLAHTDIGIKGNDIREQRQGAREVNGPVNAGIAGGEARADTREFKWPVENSVEQGSSPEQIKRKSESPETGATCSSGSGKWPMADATRTRERGARGTRRVGNGGAIRQDARVCPPTQNDEVTLLTGGFPCQPFSVAGKRRGKEDDRWLWPEMLRVIAEVRPHWVLGENVAGIVHMELDRVLVDLEGEGYATQAFIIPACAVNAPHRRDRVWIVAHSTRLGRGGGSDGDAGGGDRALQQDGDAGKDSGWAYLQSAGEGCGRQRGNGSTQPRLGDAPDGLPAGMVGWGDGWEEGVPRVAKGVEERVNKLKALGNAIVPEVAYRIIKGIADIERARLRGDMPEVKD